MSRIFDALQRSENEFDGVESELPSDATELLRRAEHRVVLEWENSDNEAVDAITPISETAGGSEPNLVQPPKTRGASFSGFQSLRLSFTPQQRMVCFDDGESPVAEAFRLLGVRIRHLGRDRALKKILITSTIQQEGKSTVAQNLAGTLALTTQQRVLLIDGDHRRSAISEVFHLGSSSGLSEYLRNEQEVEKCIYHLEGHSLWILPTGRVRSNALELLQSTKLTELIEQLSAWFDWIVIDSPPVLPLADTSVWARIADGILIVARQGITERRHLKRGLEALESKKIIGALLNCSKNIPHGYYFYGSTHGLNAKADVLSLV